MSLLLFITVRFNSVEGETIKGGTGRVATETGLKTLPRASVGRVVEGFNGSVG